MKAKQRKLSEPLVEFLLENAVERLAQVIKVEDAGGADAALEGALAVLTQKLIRHADTKRKWMAVVKELKEIAIAAPPSTEELTKAAAICTIVVLFECSIEANTVKE